jgi:hypothetical protein
MVDFESYAKYLLALNGERVLENGTWLAARFREREREREIELLGILKL